jgi:adenylate cyclase
MTTVVFADLVGSTGIFERLGDGPASHFITQLMGRLSGIFTRHGGRVVKVLGDGLFVIFEIEGEAISACVSVQKQLLEKPACPGGGEAVQIQIGVESGEVVEINGDCFGDTVNSASRLADLAGASQILTTDTVWAALLAVERAALRSMGSMYLRGRSGAIHVYRVEWQSGLNDEATMAGGSMVRVNPAVVLELMFAGNTVRMHSGSASLSFGRAADAALSINDPRVSRVHATLEWRGGQFVLADTSSFGTWVYLGNQNEAVVLRRTECYLVGSGHIVPGCELRDEDAPFIEFSVRS